MPLFKKGQIPWNKNIRYSKEIKERLNLDGLQKGRGWNRGLKGAQIAWNKGKPFPRMIGNTNGFKKGNIPINKGKHRPELAGKNHWNWNGGVTPLEHLIRNSVEYKDWCKNIYKKNYYTCQICDCKGENLEAHHIKSFFIIFQEFLKEYSQFSPVEDKETLLRLAITYQPFWDLDNGITYCKHCHKKTENNFKIKRLT